MATKAKKKREPKPKQTFVPGMEPISIPELDKLAEKYRDIRNEKKEPGANGDE